MNPQVKTQLQVRRYRPDDAVVWNALIDQSVNGTFLFRREFMDYHADRFEDFSYLVWRGPDLVAVFVAARAWNTPTLDTLVAHPGLTYGGLVCAEELKYPVLEEVYTILMETLREAGFITLLIKPVPRVFCRVPTDASLFYLHQQGFSLQSRELNSVINLTQPLRINKGRKDNIRKARLAGLLVETSEDFALFWLLLTENLLHTHGVRPVHTEAEIRLLQQRFPDNIRLYVARQSEVVVGGVVMFVDEGHGFAHTQYISATEQGKLVGAVDAILAQVLTEMQGQVPRFSFGTSTVKGKLNAGLLAQKEGFGASLELLDVYEKNI